MTAQPPRTPGRATEGHTSAKSAATVEAIARRVAELLADQPMPDDLLDAKAAAKLLGVPETWIRSEARAQRMPHVRLGHYVRFDRAELLAWRKTMASGPRTLRAGSGPVSKPRKVA